MLTGQNRNNKPNTGSKEKNKCCIRFGISTNQGIRRITKYYASGSIEPESEYILKNLNDAEIVADEKTGTVKYKGKTYDVSEIIGKTKEQKAIEEQKDVKIKQIKKQDATGEDTDLFETGKIRMIIQEENDETLKAVIPNGFYYVTGAPSTGLVISDVFGDDDDNSKSGNQFVWVPCRGTGTVAYEKTNEATVDKKYGLGSYWAKYTTEEKNTTEYKPVSKKNNQVWNYVYQKTAKILSENMYLENEIVKSQLIDSYSWDTIVEWMENEVSGIAYNSKGYGNYTNSGIKFQDSLYAVHQLDDSNNWVTAKVYKKGAYIVSGYTELATGITVIEGSDSQKKEKNIYDMAGNTWEWTTEVGNHDENQILLTEKQAMSAFLLIKFDIMQEKTKRGIE